MLVPDIIDYICPEDMLPSPLPNLEEIDAAVDREGSEIFLDDEVYGLTLFRYSPDYLVFFGPGVDADRVCMGRQPVKGVPPLTKIYAIFSAIRFNFLFNYIILENHTMRSPRKLVTIPNDSTIVKSEGSSSGGGMEQGSPCKKQG